MLLIVAIILFVFSYFWNRTGDNYLLQTADPKEYWVSARIAYFSALISLAMWIILNVYRAAQASAL